MPLFHLICRSLNANHQVITIKLIIHCCMKIKVDSKNVIKRRIPLTNDKRRKEDFWRNPYILKNPFIRSSSFCTNLSCKSKVQKFLINLQYRTHTFKSASLFKEKDLCGNCIVNQIFQIVSTSLPIVPSVERQTTIKRTN